MDETQPPQIVIYGQRGHAEVIGLQGQTNDTALVIESADEIGKIDFTRPVYLFSQTTKSVEGFQQLVAAIEEAISRQKSAVRLEAHDTICRSVANRVKQLEEFARAHEVVIFVGGKKSSNAKVLYGHCRAANEHTWFVSNEEELTNEMLAACSEAEHVGICGATSTPLWLMERCKERIEKWNTTKSKQ
jgi:4-hydroxy-3-methylbut-2-enyl diphosphate reductase